MIEFYSGTPGSGKSLHVARDIFFKICTQHKNVIANFEVNEDVLYFKKKKHGTFFYVSNHNMTINYLVNYARKYHKTNVEGQTLLIIDECQILFNPREFGKSDRLKWISFFSQHRKLGFNIILVSQMDRMVDRQIRGLFEYEYKHRKVNNFKIGMFLPVACFACIEMWYGIREKMSTSFFFYRKKYGNLYNSFKMFDDDLCIEFDDATGSIVGSTSAKAEGGPAIVPVAKLEI
jgi:zona occludens toxin